MLNTLVASLRLLTVAEKTRYFLLVLGRVSIQSLDAIGIAMISLLALLVGSDESILVGGIDVRETLNSWFGSPALGLSVLVALFFVVKSILAILLLKLSTLFLSRLETRKTAALANYFFSAGASRFEELSTGRLQWIMAGSAHIGITVVLASTATFITEAALLLAVVTVFAFVDPIATVAVTLYFAGVILVFQVLINQRLRQLGATLATNNSRVLEAIEELVNCFPEIFPFRDRSRFVNAFVGSKSMVAHSQGRQRFLSGLPRYFVESALIAGVLALIAWQLTGAESPADGIAVLGVFIAGGTRAMAALLPLQAAISELRTAGPQAVFAQEAIGLALHGEDPHNRVAVEMPSELSEASSMGARIALSDVSLKYEEAADFAVREVSVSIEPGEFVALVGSSGAGKSSLMELLIGLREPSLGRVRIDGMPPREWIQASARGLGYLSQRPRAFRGTVADNIAPTASNLEADEDKLIKVIAACALDDFVAQLANGLHENLGPHSNKLSGGQLQRLSLARALYQEPALVALDEPTSALDSITEKALEETIATLTGATRVVIAHRLRTVKRADRVLVMDKGRIIDSGTYAEVLSRHFGNLDDWELVD